MDRQETITFLQEHLDEEDWEMGDVTQAVSQGDPGLVRGINASNSQSVPFNAKKQEKLSHVSLKGKFSGRRFNYLNFMRTFLFQ